MKQLGRAGPHEASFVLGQGDLDSAEENAGLDGLAYPHAVAVDPTSGRLFVGDSRTGTVTTFRRP